MSSPLIIICAITGAETSKQIQPNLPITPQEQADAAKEAVDAGASIIHLHVREDDGKPSQRVERFKESIDAIREKVPGVVIQISTGGAIGESVANRARPLSLKPEMASLNLGTMNFGDDVFWNHPKDVQALALSMIEHGIIPELEIYEVGMLETSFKLLKSKILRPPMHYQFVLGVPGGMSGEIRNLVLLHSLLPDNSHWGVAGVGRYQLPLALHAIAMGGNVRVGFEDNVYMHKGVLAKSNAELVGRISEIARSCGRRVANPTETRKVLGCAP